MPALQRFLWLAGMLFSWGLCAGPLVREPNTTLQLPLQPGNFGYTFRPAFGALTFVNPVAVATPPGETNRLFIVERAGRIAVITNLAVPTRSVFLDISSRVRLDSFNEMGLLGLAFHPDYAKNGRFFVFYTTTASTTGAANARHNRLSEFQRSTSDPARANAVSETILFQQADDLVNHNGGDLHFGPDGYLYVSLGDEGGANDTGRNSQRIDGDFFSGILRLDVDARPGSLEPNPHPAVVGGYRIPSDNPFIGATQFNGKSVAPKAVRTEFWSVGLRNPWRMSFDGETGELWVGDVGQDRREGVLIAGRGSNHGWAFREMDVAGPNAANAPAGFLTDPRFGFVPPVWSYAHGSGTNRGNSVIGGRVYRGQSLSALYGAYVFADYVSGNVWALRRPGGGVQVERLTGTPTLAAFGEDPRNGDLLACDHGNNRILRLEYNGTFTGAALPALLSETGAFADLASLRPHPGIVPYAVNTPFWSDGALKQRWFSLPDPAKTFAFSAEDSFGTPEGAVWIKHFELELTNGVPSSRRRLETRFLVRNAGGVYGVTYRWNEAQSDAVLVGEAGDDEVLTRVVDGTTVEQMWRFPSRTECRLCHNPAAGGVLGFSAAQLNRRLSFENGDANCLEALADAGYFGGSIPAVKSLPRSAAIDEEAAGIGWRARSWLASNCGYCHRPGGPGGGQFDARLSTPTLESGLLNGLLASPFEDPAQRLIVPGDATHSEVWRRIQLRGAAQMPPLASRVVDTAGAALVERWIRSLATAPSTNNVALTAWAQTDTLILQVDQPAEVAVHLEVQDDPIGAAGVWRDVSSADLDYFIPLTPRTLEWRLPLSGSSQRFYRVRLSTP